MYEILHEWIDTHLNNISPTKRIPHLMKYFTVTHTDGRATNKESYVIVEKKHSLAHRNPNTFQTAENLLNYAKLSTGNIENTAFHWKQYD
jgi:hypothetical protein